MPLGVTFAPTALTTSPGGSVIVVGQSDGAIALRDARTLNKLDELHAHAGPVLAVRVTPDGRGMASASVDAVKTWGSLTLPDRQQAERLTRFTLGQRTLQPISSERELALVGEIAAPLALSVGDPAAATSGAS